MAVTFESGNVTSSEADVNVGKSRSVTTLDLAITIILGLILEYSAVGYFRFTLISGADILLQALRTFRRRVSVMRRVSKLRVSRSIGDEVSSAAEGGATEVLM